MSFFDIFLHAKKDIATGGRWFSREVGKKRTAKDIAPGGRRNSREVGKNVQRKMESPKGVGKVERPVKT